jgi:ATP-binding cassette subfamily F protein 3
LDYKVTKVTKTFQAQGNKSKNLPPLFASYKPNFHYLCSMLTINQLSFYFGDRAIYEEASLQIKPRERVGLIGANGAGKSTLLRLIAGEYTPDSGSLSKAKDCTIGFLNQDLLSYESEESILKVAMQAFERPNRLQARIDEILKKLETDYSDTLLDELSNLQAEFETLGGYSIQAQAEAILEGLGFQTADLKRPLREFSGGWRMRVMLAKLLLQKPSLLLLDEPTNHLDLPSIEWIETYLQSYEGAVVIVSHDQNFLNNCCNVIVEVWNGKLDRYPGNYDFYVEEKALRAELQQKAYENQQQKIRELERFIERFRAKATKAKQAQSRIKQLEKIERIEAVDNGQATMSVRFRFRQPSGKVVAKLKDVSKSYGDLKILEASEAQIDRGDKIALIGANGKGKSTLLRLLAGKEAFEGTIQNGHNVLTSFYAQHQLESLNLSNDLLEELKQHSADRTEAELRTILGCFLFVGDDIFKKIKVLSGGEKARVALAKMLLSESNFLLLDEPTNHLDMFSVDVLIDALQKYEGTFVTVSHNRYFISQIANKIWWIEDYKIKEYPGTYDEFKQWYSKREEAQKELQKETRKQDKITQKLATPQTAKAQNPTISQEERKEIQKKVKKAEKEAEQWEAQILQYEAQAQAIEQLLAEPQHLADPEKMQRLSRQYQDLKKQIEAATQKWEEALAQAERLLQS